MKKKILVVDDSSEDLETMKTVLQKEYEVITADNGAEALDILKGDGFSGILIDVQMPTLSGYDLLRLMREKVNHSVKMIYVTIIPKQEVNLEDIDGFVQKPFSPETLLAEVNRVL